MSTSQVTGVCNEMRMDDYNGQMIFGDPVGLKLPDICLTSEKKPRKKLTQETCPDWGSNPGPLRDKRTSHRLFHSGWPHVAIHKPLHCARVTICTPYPDTEYWALISSRIMHRTH